MVRPYLALPKMVAHNFTLIKSYHAKFIESSFLVIFIVVKHRIGNMWD